MRVVKKILKITLIIVFIIGIAFNVILGVSATSFSILTNKDKALKEIYYKSYSSLMNSNELTIEFTQSHSEVENGFAIDKISCGLDEKTQEINCQMISKLYDSSSKLIRTSYFPGDGYKYSEENSKKTKTAHSNYELLIHFSSLVNEIIDPRSPFSYIIADSSTAETYSMKTKTGFYFDIDTFSLNKKISVTYSETKDKVESAKMRFNSHDQLQYLELNPKHKYSISYKYTKLNIPSLIGFSA